MTPDSRARSDPSGPPGAGPADTGLQAPATARPGGGRPTRLSEPGARPRPARRPRSADGRRPRRVALAVVFCLASLHALAYAAIFPPWALEDESQHVDYVWKLAFDHRLPDLDDHLADPIVDSSFATDRWTAYGAEPPYERTVESMGLAGYSYEAYHPPLPYLVVVPVVDGAARDPLVAMYGLRVVTALAVGALGLVTAHLASRRLRGGSAVRAALGAGLAVALLPAVAESGGRFNTDIFGALAVTVAVLTLVRWHEASTSARAWTVGAALTAAALTRETTIVVIVPLLVVGALARRDGRLTAGAAARALVPPLAAIAAWELHVRAATGRWNGASAFIDAHGRQFPALHLGDMTSNLLGRALVPFGSWSYPLPLVLLVLGLVGAGVVRAARHGHKVEALTVTAMFAFQLVLMGSWAEAGLNTVTARLLMPSYPVVIAVATVGWTTVRARAAAYLPALACLLLGAWFLLADFAPAYR